MGKEMTADKPAIVEFNTAREESSCLDFESGIAGKRMERFACCSMQSLYEQSRRSKHRKYPT